MKISKLTLSTIATLVAFCIFVSGCESYRYTFETESPKGDTGEHISYTVVEELDAMQYSSDALPVVVDSQILDRVHDIKGGKKVINSLCMFLTVASLGIVPSVYEGVGTENVRDEYQISIETPIGSRITKGYVYQREWWGLICMFGFGDINKVDLPGSYSKRERLRESKMQEEALKMREAAVRDLVYRFEKEDFYRYVESVNNVDAKVSAIRQMIVSGEIERAIKECQDAKSSDWGVAAPDNCQWEDLITEACERIKTLVSDIDDAERLANLYSLLDTLARNQSVDEQIFLRLSELNKVDVLPYTAIEYMANNAESTDVKVAAIQNLKDADKVRAIVWNVINNLLPDAANVAISTLAYVKDEKAATDILTVVMENSKDGMPKALAEVSIPDKVVSNVICNMDLPWQNLIDKVTPECAHSILVDRGQKVEADAAFEKALVDRLAESKFDVNLYDMVSSHVAKEAVMTRMPAGAKAIIQERENLRQEAERQAELARQEAERQAELERIEKESIEKLEALEEALTRYCDKMKQAVVEERWIDAAHENSSMRLFIYLSNGLKYDAETDCYSARGMTPRKSEALKEKLAAMVEMMKVVMQRGAEHADFCLDQEVPLTENAITEIIDEVLYTKPPSGNDIADDLEIKRHREHFLHKKLILRGTIKRVCRSKLGKNDYYRHTYTQSREIFYDDDTDMRLGIRRVADNAPTRVLMEVWCGNRIVIVNLAGMSADDIARLTPGSEVELDGLVWEGFVDRQILGFEYRKILKWPTTGT